MSAPINWPIAASRRWRSSDSRCDAAPSRCARHFFATNF
jgi:hypothetical protein